MRKWNKNLQPQQSMIACIAFFLVTLSAYLFYQNFSFSLQYPEIFYFAQATKDGIDISARVTFYHILLFGSIAFYLLFYYLLKKWVVQFSPPAEWLQLISVLSIGCTFCILEDCSQLTTTYSIWAFLIMIISSVTLYCIGLVHVGLRWLWEPNLHIILFSFSYIVHIASFLFVQQTAIGNFTFLLHFSIAFLLICTILIISKQLLRISIPLFLRYLTPFFIIPFLVFIAIEAAIYFHLVKQVSFQVALVFISLFVICYPIILFIHHKYFSNYTTNKILSRFILPSALFSYILLSHYVPYGLQFGDLFEFANPANAQLKIFHEHQIPLVDFMSSHMLSEQFYGLIYHAFFPYSNTLDFMVYQFLYDVLFYFLVYSFCSKLFQSAPLAILFILIFPFIDTFFSMHLFFAVIGFYSFYRCISKPSLQNYIFHLLLFPILLFWRLDVGAAYLLGSVFFLPISYFVLRPTISWKKIWKALAILSIIFLLCIGIICLIRNPMVVLSNLQCFLHYTQANQAHGYSLLANTSDHHVYFFYVGIPLLSILSIFVLVSKAIYWKKQHQTFQCWLCLTAIFFHCITLANFQRGLVRHHFIENTELFLLGTFYLAIAITIIGVFEIQHIVQRFTIFIICGFILLFGFTYFPLPNGASYLEQSICSSPLVRFQELLQEKKKNRVQILSNTVFPHPLETFMQKHFSKNQTFFDFSNNPILYSLCQRTIPSYFCQSQQNAVDDWLQKKDILTWQTKNIPVVVYANNPRTWYDSVDGVSNILRQSMYAEHIYANYKPYGVVKNLSIWIDKNLTIDKIPHQNIDSSSFTKQHHSYGFAAAYLHSVIAKQKVQSIKLVTIADTANKLLYHTKIDKQFTQQNSIIAFVNIGNMQHGDSLTGKIFSDTTCIGSFDFRYMENNSNYAIRLSNHYLWYQKFANRLEIASNKNYSLHSIEILKEEK